MTPWPRGIELPPTRDAATFRRARIAARLIRLCTDLYFQLGVMG